MLNKNVFERITQRFQYYPKIDLFASRLDKELPVFVSYRRDPKATHVNAFSLKRKLSFMHSHLFL